jgi:TP901 family phage tail tape measure protein
MAAPFVISTYLQIQKVLGLEAARAQVMAALQGVSASIGKSLQTAGPQAKASTSGAAAQAKAAQQIALAQAGIGSAASQGAKGQKAFAASLNQSATAAGAFGQQMFLAAKRNLAFIASMAVPFAAYQGFAAGTASVVDFDLAMTKLAQVLGTSKSSLGDMGEAFIGISRATGTSVTQVTDVAQALAQAGYSGDKLIKTTESISRVPLLPAFESIESTIQGVIAVMAQFSDEGLTAEDIMDRLVLVSNKYAVTSTDLVEAIKRGGASFESVGGSLDEYIAAVTTIGHVTQQSASNVGTAMKTISSRLADPKIIAALERRGIQMRVEGDFVGPAQAIRNIGKVMQETQSVIGQTDIVNLIGGRRQMSQVLALTKNTDMFNQALGYSQNASGSAARAMEEGLKSISARLSILKADALAFALSLRDDVFAPAISAALVFGKALTTIGTVLRPLIPMLTAAGLAFGGKAIMGTLGGVGGKMASYLGMGGLLAGGIGGAQAPFQRRVQYQPGILPGTGQMVSTPPSRFAGVGRVMATQGGQLVALAGVEALVSSLANNESDAGRMTASAATAAATVATIASILKKQTVSQFMTKGGMLPSLGKLGGAATLGIAAFGAIGIEAAAIQKEFEQKIIDRTRENLSQVSIDYAAGKTSMKESVGEIFKQITGTIEEVSASRLIGEASTLSDGVQRFFSNMGTILSGDISRVGSFSGMGEAEQATMINDLMQKSRGTIDGMIEAVGKSFADTGGNVAPQELLKQFLGDVGLPKESINGFSTALIKSVGGLSDFNEKVGRAAKAVKDRTDDEQEAQKEFRAISHIVPPTLISELLQLERGVRDVSRVVATASSEWEANFGAITGLTARRAPEGMGPKSVERVLAGGQVAGMFKLPNVQNYVRETKLIEDMVDNFIMTLGEQGQRVTKEGYVGVLDDFLKSTNNVPEDIKDALRQTLSKIGAAFETGFTSPTGDFIDLEGLRSNLKDNLKRVSLPARDAIVASVSEYLKNVIAGAQLSIEQNLSMMRLEIETATTPGALKSVLQKYGPAGEVITPPLNIPRETPREQLQYMQQTGYGGPLNPVARETAQFVMRPEVVAKLANEFMNLQRDVLTARQALVQGPTTSQSYEDAVREYENLSKQLNAVSVELDLMGRSVASASATQQAAAKIEYEAAITRINQRAKVAPEKVQGTLGLAAFPTMPVLGVTGLDTWSIDLARQLAISSASLQQKSTDAIRSFDYSLSSYIDRVFGALSAQLSGEKAAAMAGLAEQQAIETEKTMAKFDAETARGATNPDEVNRRRVERAQAVARMDAENRNRQEQYARQLEEAQRVGGQYPQAGASVDYGRNPVSVGNPVTGYSAGDQLTAATQKAALASAEFAGGQAAMLQQQNAALNTFIDRLGEMGGAEADRIAAERNYLLQLQEITVQSDTIAEIIRSAQLETAASVVEQTRLQVSAAQLMQEAAGRIRDDLSSYGRPEVAPTGNTAGVTIDTNELTEGMRELSRSIQSPGAISLDASTRVEFDVRGLGDEIRDSIKVDLERAANKAAKMVVSQAFRSLGASSGGGSMTEGLNRAADTLASE